MLQRRHFHELTMGAFFLIAYIVIGIAQVWAGVEGMQLTFGIGGLLAVVLLLVAYAIPIVGTAAVAFLTYYGARYGWSWTWGRRSRWPRRVSSSCLPWVLRVVWRFGRSVCACSSRCTIISQRRWQSRATTGPKPSRVVKPGAPNRNFTQTLCRRLWASDARFLTL